MIQMFVGPNPDTSQKNLELGTTILQASFQRHCYSLKDFAVYVTLQFNGF